MTTSTGSALAAIVVLVAVVGTSAARTSAPIWAAVEPTLIALFGSTVTITVGVALTRSLLRLTRSVLSDRASRTVAVAASTSFESSPDTTTLRLLEVKPADSDTFTSNPSVLTGVRAVDSSCVLASRSTPDA